MEKHVLHIAVFGILALTGCSSKQDANEKNFGAAIGHYLDQKGELCLRLNKWPVDVTEMDLRLQKSAPTGTAGQMEALAAVGLVSGEDTEIDQISIFDKKPTGRKFKIKRYTLTDSGRKFYKEKEVDRTGFARSKKIMQGDICYGKKNTRQDRQMGRADEIWRLPGGKREIPIPDRRAGRLDRKTRISSRFSLRCPDHRWSRQ